MDIGGKRAWREPEQSATAGAYFFALLSHGPLIRKVAAEMQGLDLEKPEHSEHKGADDEMVFNDIHAGVEFAAHLTMLAWDVPLFSDTLI